MKKLVLGGVLAAGLMFAGVGSATAGEYTGNGGNTQARGHAQSECMFSGQDMPDSVEGHPAGFDDDWLSFSNPGNGNTRTHGVQNYGQFVAVGMKGVVPSPGDACRGFPSMD